jgi:hypothetical protein
MKIHVIQLDHKHGSDILLVKDAPTQLQLSQMKGAYEKAHDIEIYGVHYVFYEDINHMLTTEQTMFRLKQIMRGGKHEHN